MLVERQVWLFSSGPTSQGDPVELLKGWRFPDAQKSIIDRIQPRDITAYHGAVELKKLNPLHKFMVNKVKSPVGDFRDWDTITSWAAAIANELTEKRLTLRTQQNSNNSKEQGRGNE